VSASNTRTPFLVLPGFQPDALAFAARTTLALLLAYWIAFSAQVSSASTAGVCVAIIAQPSAGMAFSKAIYRMIGTLFGGVVGVALLGLFPQDRVMLLAGFILWVSLCAFVANLLRDFRSYGAALSGYTVGIIAIATIDAPQTGLVTMLNRVAAIAIGILAVMVVNSLLAGPSAFDGLVRDLRQRVDTMTALVVDTLEGRPLAQDNLALVRLAAGVAALETQAVYAASERPDGAARAVGARHAIAALLAMVSAARAIAATLGPDTQLPIRNYLLRVAAIMRGPQDNSGPGQPPRPATPTDALLLERANELLTRHRQARAGLQALSEGGIRLAPIRLERSYDLPGATFGALRTVIAVGLCAVFCMASGWTGTSLVLLQQASFVALLSTLPNPSRASLPFMVALVPVALAVGLVNFFVLPGVSGFVPFALAITPVVFASALLVRQPSLASYGPAVLLYATLLLAPSNTETYSISSYANTVLLLGAAGLFTWLAFALVLPVSPSRRLFRVAWGIAADLRHTLHTPGRGLDRPVAQSLLYDRMAQALVWLGRPTPSRLRLLRDLYGMGEVDLALRRARTGLAAAAESEPLLADAVADATRALESGEPTRITQAAQALLDHPLADFRVAAIWRATSGMAGVARLIGQDRSPLRLYRRLTS
jgi:uncharacterized membrane protein YccC